MKLIGIAGPARSGKDTAAVEIIEQMGAAWDRAAFADTLKAAVSCLGVSAGDEGKDTINPHYGVTPRYMWETLGTEWGRDTIHPDIWVRAFALVNAGRSLVVPDVRFENEADLVRRHGVMIHIAGREGLARDHKSAAGVERKAGDLILDNSAGMWEYNGKIKELCNALFFMGLT